MNDTTTFYQGLIVGAHQAAEQGFLSEAEYEFLAALLTAAHDFDMQDNKMSSRPANALGFLIQNTKA